ncbi:MAG: hypothetical protein OXI88_08990 [Gammaproteobacteria bacterium]|nr:hypothetical protein [Gammaproteobacteria bacterium]
MIQITRVLLGFLLLVSGAAVADNNKSHEQLTAESRALMENFLKVHKADNFSLREIVKFYHKDLKATYYRPTGIFTFTSAQQYYDAYKPEKLTTYDFDYEPWSEPLLLLVDGDNAVVRYIGHARTIEGEYHNHYIHMYKIRDGKIVEYHAMTNPHSDAHYARNRQFLKDLGLYKGGEQ